jgi:hypothetical protein
MAGKITRELGEFLHKFVDHVGAGSLHTDIDGLVKDEEKTAEKDASTDAKSAVDGKGKEDTTNA